MYRQPEPSDQIFKCFKLISNAFSFPYLYPLLHYFLRFLIKILVLEI